MLEHKVKLRAPGRYTLRVQTKVNPPVFEERAIIYIPIATYLQGAPEIWKSTADKNFVFQTREEAVRATLEDDWSNGIPIDEYEESLQGMKHSIPSRFDEGKATDCLCGCGQFPASKRGKFLAGHDAKLKAQLRKLVKGELSSDDLHPHVAENASEWVYKYLGVDLE